MNHCRPLVLLAFGCLLLTLGACDDPSGVGLGIGPDGFEGGTPVTIDLEPTNFEVTTTDDVTGNSARILAGRVEDPMIGTTEATGHLDVIPPNSPPDDFVDATVEKAQLVLVPGYVYGDTVQTQQIALHEMPSEWDHSGRSSDEPLSAGAMLTESASFVPGEKVTITLPDGWVSSQSLTDTTDFADNFHGFQLRASGGNAVVGYELSDSFLRVIAAGDTVAYPVYKSFTSIENTNPSSPTDRVLVQDGIGRTLSFSFTLPDSLKNVPLSRAVLHLETDTTLFEQAALPQDFARPRTNVLSIQGFLEGSEEDSAPAFIVGVSDSVSTKGHFAFSQGDDLLTDPRLAPRTVSLLNLFQRTALGEVSIDRYRVTLRQNNNTINPLFFYAPGTGEHAPRVSLTFTKPDA